ncbi:hypothetical protein GCM10010156_34490 [Planobispora rosea]|uniref:Uncharacterized protein n=1 Tax=Planobispora rosea TaxID=35762 RepID=A0A8J3S1H0_PLARO|nr:hypothetical protein GCM10010156_34490 [Planobispora rosea]GIH85313.1 hypothetical protein Pro02_37210 [Planobispora rosea]
MPRTRYFARMKGEVELTSVGEPAQEIAMLWSGHEVTAHRVAWPFSVRIVRGAPPRRTARIENAGKGWRTATKKGCSRSHRRETLA